MKVRITTQHGAFDAELDEGMTATDLFPSSSSDPIDGGFPNTLVSFVVTAEDAPVRVTMLKSLTRIVEEDL